MFLNISRGLKKVEGVKPGNLLKRICVFPCHLFNRTPPVAVGKHQHEGVIFLKEYKE